MHFFKKLSNVVSGHQPVVFNLFLNESFQIADVHFTAGNEYCRHRADIRCAEKLTYLTKPLIAGSRLIYTFVARYICKTPDDKRTTRLIFQQYSRSLQQLGSRCSQSRRCMNLIEH